MKPVQALLLQGSLAHSSTQPLAPEVVSALKRLIRYLGEQGISIEGAGNALAGDISELAPDRVSLVDAACHTIAALRRMQDALPKTDKTLEYSQLLPDEVHNDYALLFRSICRSEQELFAILAPHFAAMRLRNNGFSNISIFPDGRGSAIIDNFGMSGVWMATNVPSDMPTRLVIRVFDSISKAVGDSLNIDEMVAVEFADTLPTEALVLLCGDIRICVARAFSQRARYRQVEILTSLLQGNKHVIVRHIDRDSMPSACDRVPNRETAPDVIVTQIALVEELHSKDYHHYKCSQKVEIIARRLQAQGYDAVYVPIEDEIGYEEFLLRYRQDLQDVVLISMYQVKSDELALYHRFAADIRSIHPRVFIVVEGASTNMAKQFLALSPEIDMLVRGEADVAISVLLAIKAKGRPLAEEDLHRLRSGIVGGFVVRSGKSVLASNLDRTNINTDIHLLDPERYLHALWYSERGCPCECLFCRRDTGGKPHRRNVSADERITWMLKRLILELDPNCGVGIDRLQEILRMQAHHPDAILPTHPEIRLLPDTFLGKQKVAILVLSENALAIRDVMMSFARQARELGLSKYFDLKIADTGIGTLLRHDRPDRELMRALGGAGVSFIGFGTENLSREILFEMHKGYPWSYTLDDIVSVNNALIESGFSPTSVRNNLVFSTPYSTLSNVKDSILLTYISPVFNSMPEYFGHGWGNNRFNRTFDVASSAFTAMDHLQYSWTYLHAGMEDRGGYFVSDYFFISKDTPEYVMRQGLRYLRYVDERIPVFAAKFGFPTFYRFAQKEFLRNYFTDEDVRRAVDRFRESGPRSADLGSKAPRAEERALGDVMAFYMKQWPEKSPRDLLVILKAHMISLRAYSFVLYRDLVESRQKLPSLFEKFRISETVDIADALMMPGTFYPDKCMESLRKAVLTAALVEAFGDYDFFLETILLTCLSPILDVTEMMSEVSAAVVSSADIDKIRSLLEADEAWKRHDAQYGYLAKIAYPDRQAFELIRHLYVHASDESLFAMVVSRMNEKRLHFPEAVKELSCERLSLPLAEHPLFVMAVREYSKNKIYFCRGGLLDRLRSDDREYVSQAVGKLLLELENENNPYVIDIAAVALAELAQGGPTLEVGVFISSAPVMSKISTFLRINASKILNLGPRLVIIDQSVHNTEKSRILQMQFPNVVFSEAQISVLDRGDWICARLAEGHVFLPTTLRNDLGFLERYADNMKFKGNVSLFSSYIDRFSALSGRHKLQIMAEIAAYFEVVTDDRPYLRAMMLPAEESLYILPLVKLVTENDELVPIFVARGMEPSYSAYLNIMRHLLPHVSQDNHSIYTKITKKEKRELPDYIRRTPRSEDAVASEVRSVYLSINTLLTTEEACRPVTCATWDAVAERAAALGLAESLDTFLICTWEFTGGFADLISRELTLSEAVKYISGFGLDDDYIKYSRTVRRAFFTLPLMSCEFSNSPRGYPAEKLAQEVREKNATLEYRLNDLSLAHAIYGINSLSGPDRLALREQRNAINNHIMTFGNADAAGLLKRRDMPHGARPLLNILLKGTRVQTMLQDTGNSCKTVLYADETSSTATTAVLCEIVMKAFQENIRFEGFNVSSRTAGTEKVLAENDLIRYVATRGIWIVEDMHEIFSGIYEDNGRDGKAYVSFSDLADRLRGQAAEEQRKSGLSESQIRSRIAEIDRRADLVVESNRVLFEVVDKVKTRKYDARTVKRQIVKCVLRSDDWLQRSLAEEDYFVCLSIGEFDFIGRYFFVHLVEELIADGFAAQLGELRAIDRDVRFADQALEVGRLARNSERLGAERSAVSESFMIQMDGPVGAYLDGRIDFEEVERIFYETYVTPVPGV